MGTGFGQCHLNLITAVGGQLDDDIVDIARQVAIAIFHADVDRVAWLDLVGRSDLRNSTITSSICFAFEFLAECLLFDVFNLAAGDFKLRVCRDTDFNVGQRHVLEFSFEFIGIVTLDDILTGQLQHMIVFGRLSQASFQVGPEQPLSGTGADEEDHFGITAGNCGDSNRNPIVTAADPQIAVVHNDRKRSVGDMSTLAGPPQSSHRTQQVQLIDIAFFGSVNFGQIEQSLVGEFDIGNSFEHAAKDLACFIAIATSKRQHTP